MGGCVEAIWEEVVATVHWNAIPKLYCLGSKNKDIHLVDMLLPCTETTSIKK